jgi:hypothetical protein
MAKGHSSAVIGLSHLEIAWFSIERAAEHSVPFERSTRPFPLVVYANEVKVLVFVVNCFLKCLGTECSVVRML